MLSKKPITHYPSLITHSQSGITSLSALLIVLLVVIVIWQGGKYIDNYFDYINESGKAAQDAAKKYNPNCTGQGCDTDEGAGQLPPPYTPPADNEIFSWQDDERP